MMYMHCKYIPIQVQKTRTVRLVPTVCGFVSTGKLNVKDNELEEMLKEATGPINFTMFLNLFGEKLHGKQ